MQEKEGESYQVLIKRALAMESIYIIISEVLRLELTKQL